MREAYAKVTDYLVFKLDQSANVALQQIHDKKYADKYRALQKPTHLFGVSFTQCGGMEV